jgi:TonB family protein
MQRLLKNFSDMHKSVLLSTAVHLILLLIFLLVRSGIDLGNEFAEIGFASAAPAARQTTAAPVTTKAATPAPAKTTAPAEKPTQPAASKPAAELKPKTPPVNLPKRRMLEEEKPTLTTTRERDKLTPAPDAVQDIIEKPATRADNGRMEQGAQTTPGPSNQDTAGGGTTSGNAEGPVASSGTEKGLPYTIEGDAANRRILSQVLPAYPPDLQREAVVRIRFWVLPDGRIGQMIPVKKGDPQLETLTMQAMRQWRFNALSSSDEQKNAQGVITFVYKLK